MSLSAACGAESQFGDSPAGCKQVGNVIFFFTYAVSTCDYAAFSVMSFFIQSLFAYSFRGDSHWSAAPWLLQLCSVGHPCIRTAWRVNTRVSYSCFPTIPPLKCNVCTLSINKSREGPWKYKKKIYTQFDIKSIRSIRSTSVHKT